MHRTVNSRLRRLSPAGDGRRLDRISVLREEVFSYFRVGVVNGDLI